MTMDELTGNQLDLLAAAESTIYHMQCRPSETFRTHCRHSEKGIYPCECPYFAPNESGFVGCDAEEYVRIDKEEEES